MTTSKAFSSRSSVQTRRGRMRLPTILLLPRGRRKFLRPTRKARVMIPSPTPSTTRSTTLRLRLLRLPTLPQQPVPRHPSSPAPVHGPRRYNPPPLIHHHHRRRHNRRIIMARASSSNNSNSRRHTLVITPTTILITMDGIIMRRRLMRRLPGQVSGICFRIRFKFVFELYISKMSILTSCPFE